MTDAAARPATPTRTIWLDQVNEDLVVIDQSYRAGYLRDIEAALGRHGGAELLRRCMGIVSVAEIEAIEDPEARASVECGLIQVGRAWLLTPATADEDIVARLTSQAAATTLRGGKDRGIKA